MQRRRDEELADRFLDFSVRIVKLVDGLPKTSVGKHIGRQILSSGTSPGANYEEARGSESNADFIHKLSIVLKELKESRYWLQVIQRTFPASNEKIESLKDECEQLIAIIAKSISMARKRK
ncbi:MAG: four helix bundle protein [Deltaproteobacteria bacterium]|nr:four helix bundle protein [Deltaproteobacteria bacterium]